MLNKTTQGDLILWITIPNRVKIIEFHLKGCCSLLSEPFHAPSNYKSELSNESSLWQKQI